MLTERVIFKGITDGHKTIVLERNMKHQHCGTLLIIMKHVLFVFFEINLLSKCFVVKQITVDIIGIPALCVEIFMLPIYPDNLQQVLTICQGKFTGQYVLAGNSIRIIFLTMHTHAFNFIGQSIL